MAIVLKVGSPRGISETQLVIDIIRFALASIKDSSNSYLIGIEGEVPRTISRYPFIIPLRNEIGFHEINRGISKITIDLQDILKKSQCHVLTDIANSDKINDFEKAILSSVQWFSHAEKQSINENKILSLITCLETFLSGEYGSPIRNTVAEGCAISIRKELAQRKYIKQRLNEFYKQRSSISHGSSSKGVKDSDISELKQIVQLFIREMISRREEFSSTKQFMDWINDMRLS